jgi:hypothetical protein
MISPGLAAFAAPLAGAVASAAADTVRGLDAAFEKLLVGDDEQEVSAKDSAEVDAAGLPTQFDALVRQFTEQASARLAEAGIKLDSDLVLESDSLGEMRVASGHPQAAEIERILASDSNLAEAFSQLSRVHRQLSSHRRAEEMDRLYALDPNAAWRRESESLLDEAPLRVTLSAPAIDRG